MVSRFSEDGKYFAQLTNDGKLKIWNTSANTLDQEYTPDYHLTTPCTCLHFIENPGKNRLHSDEYPARKKKKGHSSIPDVLLGTTRGILLFYSISQSKLAYTIDSTTNQTINCLCAKGTTVYSGAGSSIIQWNVSKKQVITKWKAGNEKISAISTTSDPDSLLTASKSIKLWSISRKDVVRRFVGHNSEVCYLRLVNDSYFVSGSKGDRLLNCWNLSDQTNDTSAIVSFLMEDVVENVSMINSTQGYVVIAAATRSGLVHVYQHTLNGRNKKPIKHKTTIQVVPDSSDSNEKVSPIHIMGAVFRDENTLGIGYGSQIILAFENIVINYTGKIQYLIRKDPGVIATSNAVTASKTKIPRIDNKVYYLTPQSIGIVGKKRTSSHGKQLEVPMEQRLENLKLTQLDSSSKVPKLNNVAQLLLQGLHSRDKAILHTVLCKREESVIKNTLSRLPLQVMSTLIEELTEFLRGKTMFSQIGVLWLRCLMQTHASVLLANPNLVEMLKPVLGCLDNRLSLFHRLNMLNGRLELLVDSNKAGTSAESSQDNDALLVFTDKDSCDSDSDAMDLDENDGDGSEMEVNSEVSSESESGDSEVNSGESENEGEETESEDNMENAVSEDDSN